MYSSIQSTSTHASQYCSCSFNFYILVPLLLCLLVSAGLLILLFNLSHSSLTSVLFVHIFVHTYYLSVYAFKLLFNLTLLLQLLLHTCTHTCIHLSLLRFVAWCLEFSLLFILHAFFVCMCVLAYLLLFRFFAACVLSKNFNCCGKSTYEHWSYQTALESISTGQCRHLFILHSSSFCCGICSSLVPLYLFSTLL